MSHFRETKTIFKKMFNVVSEKGTERDDLLEAAFFAYAHRNPLIDFLFWRRLSVAERYVLSKGAKRVLDFGYGSGVMSYCFAKSGLDVVGVDIDTKPLDEAKKHISFPPGIAFVSPQQLEDARYNESFDCIVALDVLEHIEDLSEFVALAKRVLKKDGFVVVSGPTENILYQIGRKVAGKQFTGTYHVSNIARIRERLAKDLKIEHISTLFPFVPLFELFTARKV
jgi:2-polyprenyl-3-methyl-5-hydroxy-6-metoxy-1,4-benzoquinol methylase